MGNAFNEPRDLYLFGEMDSKLTATFVPALEKLDREPGEIRIVLNSVGGDEQEGYAIYDAIMRCHNHITMEGYGSVMSIAAAVFQAGDVRLLSENAVFHIHHGIIGVNANDEGMVDQDDVLETAQAVIAGNKKYYNILARSGQTHKDIADWCRLETSFNAKDAVAVGFADGLLKPVKQFSKPVVKKRKKRR